MKVRPSLRAMLPGFICALGLVLVADQALAQPRSGRRPGRGQRVDPPRPGAMPPSATNPAMCAAKQSVVETEQRRLDERKATLAGIEAEIEQLTRRLEDLQARRAQLSGEVAASQVHLKYKREDIGAGCRDAVNCKQYEDFVSDMEQQNKPIEEQMGRIRTEISDSRRDVTNLRRRIEPLQREYKSKECNRMVAGQTSQSTIDRCSAIFSEWNQLQGDLNRLNSRLPILRSRYQQLAAKLRSTEERAKDYEEYLSRNCKRSGKLGIVRRFRNAQGQSGRMQEDLNRLIEEVRNLKSIEITID